VSNLHRIQWIDNQIRESHFPNCTTIAAQFEITRRQASRDVEYLRYSLGAPVEYDHERRGYAYGEEFEIPKEKLNASDISLLAELSRSYEQIDTNAGKKIADLFSRLYRGTGTSNLVPVEADSIAGIRALIETCIRNTQDIRITYIDAGNNRTCRRITPDRMIQWGENELLEGWCHLRNGERQFRLDRISKIETAGDSDPGQRDVLVTKTESTAEIAATVVQTDDDPGLFSRKPFIAEIQTGFYLKTKGLYSFYDSTKLFAWLLRHHQLFQITHPQWLRHRAKKHFKQLASFHRK
jgi:predicted DNA-binding transcriptional regulator YafY